MQLKLDKIYTLICKLLVASVLSFSLYPAITVQATPLNNTGCCCPQNQCECAVSANSCCSVTSETSSTTKQTEFKAISCGFTSQSISVAVLQTQLIAEFPNRQLKKAQFELATLLKIPFKLNMFVEDNDKPPQYKLNC